MGIDFPNSPSAGDTYTYEGETYRYNGVAFVKVRDRVTTFNGATGAIIGVTSVQGKTGDVTLTDLEITHGVETFNGLSGSIDTTSLDLPVNGITSSGRIITRGGFFNISSTNLLKIGKPGTGFGSGPFDPLTYSFPDEIAVAGAADKTNPSILVSHGPLLGGEGNNPLVFDKLGQFAVNSFNGLTGAVVTDTLTLPVAGITASSGISCAGNLFIGGDIISKIITSP